MQFGLRALFVVTLTICVLCAILFAVPDGIALLLLLIVSLHFPATAVVGIVYCERNLRAFCIGAVSGMANVFFLNLLYTHSMVLEAITAFWVVPIESMTDSTFGKLVFVLWLGTCLTGGLVGIAIRRLATARSNQPHDTGTHPPIHKAEVPP